MKVHKEGIPSVLFVLISALTISGLCLYFSKFSIWSIALSILLFGFALFVVSFFRAPSRPANGSATQVVAPADGKVIIIEEVEEPEYFKDKRLKVSIFMSFFNVHMNWIPITGQISYYKYHPGLYLAAWHPKSSTKNERSTIVVKNENGTEVLCRQIAGLVARRVVSYVNEGQNFKASDEMGFIKFGSRADLYFPIGTKLNVELGDKVKGSTSIIAELNK